MPPSMPPARLERRVTPGCRGSISSCAFEPRRRAVANPSPISTPLIAWMPISAGRQPGVELAIALHERTEPRWQAVDQHLDHTAEGVAVGLGRLDLGDQRVGRALVAGRGPGDASIASRSLRGRQRAVDGVGVTDRHHVGNDFGTEHLAQELLGDGAQRHPGRGLPGGSTLQHRAGVVEAVLLHAGQVGVTGARPGQRSIASQAGEHLGCPPGPAT